MILLFLSLILCILILAIAYYSYRIGFYSPKRNPEENYKLPQGKQYEKELKNIKMWIEEVLALPYEEIYISAHDGKKLFGRYYHTADNAPVQIMLHGYKSSAYLDFCGGIKFALKSKQNILVVDQRSHGKSDGSTITFGIEERHDCVSWINYICRRFGTDTKIILSGLSMGAATVLMTANLNLPSNVAGIIADCPYSSPKEIIQKVCQEDMHLPAKLMYPFIKLGAQIFGHFDLEECDALSAVKQSDLPILIFHGDDDRFVPCAMSQKLKEACPDNVTLEIVHGAGHGLCYLIGPKQYEEAMTHFLNRISVKAAPNPHQDSQASLE